MVGGGREWGEGGEDTKNDEEKIKEESENTQQVEVAHYGTYVPVPRFY